jgi:hypothetical protein
MIKLFGFTVPLAYGRGIFQYSFGFMPHRHPLNVVIGSPIDIPKIEEPSKEEIDKWHAKYVLL